MPLYSDSNYYYSGGSSQLYSPYYSPGAYSSATSSPSSSSSSSSYGPFTSSYNRAMSGTYVVPPPRAPTYTSHLASRYQPKLSTITETLPIMGGARHSSLMPLTRIQSPKFSTYTSPSSSTTSSYTPKYIAPRPISMNTADIDVSSTSRFRKHKEEETEKTPIKEKEVTTSPTSSQKKRKSITEDSSKDDEACQQAADERKGARSTIKRNRAVVRLSTIRSRSKNRSPKSFKSSAESNHPQESNHKIFKDLPESPAPEVSLSWREKLADDLAAIPTYPIRKSPGDLIRERYLIQDDKRDETTEPTAIRRLRPMEQAIEDVVIEIDPLHHTIRRLSIPQCPSFHEICEDISSDKIDDDLNAGELRRRASLIQEQEQEILNQLQNSASGTYQFIHLERQESSESLLDDNSRRSMSKRKSKKAGKRIRHKITATVEIENTPLTPIMQENEEEATPKTVANLASKPKFTFNLDAVEEHHEIHTVFKLPKKRSIKKPAKPKEIVLPEGFMSFPTKAKTSSPKVNKAKKETLISNAQIFTFDQSCDKANETEQMRIRDCSEESTVKESSVEQLESPKSTADDTVDKHSMTETTSTLTLSQNLESLNALKSATNAEGDDEKLTAEVSQPLLPDVPKPALDVPKALESPKTIKSVPRNTTSLEQAKHAAKKLDKNSESPFLSLDPKTKIAGDKAVPATAVLKSSKSVDVGGTITKNASKPFEKSQSFNIEGTKPDVDAMINTAMLQDKNSTSLDATSAPALATSSKTLEKAKSLNAEEPSVATPKPIRKFIQKSESSEDFWSQIGSRETLYMTNRKQNLLDNQLEQQLNLIELEIVEPAKNLSSTKCLAAEAAAKSANDDMRHKNEDENEPNKIENMQTKKKTSPIKKISPSKDQVKLQTSKEVNKTKVGLESKTKTMPPPLLVKTTIASPLASQTTTTATPKINTGQAAKSPEQQENIFATSPALTPTEMPTAAVKAANDKNKTPINNTIIETTTKSVAAIEHSKNIATEIANKIQPDIKTTKLAEAVKKPSPQKTTTATAKTAKLPATKPKVAASATGKAKSSPTARTSPSSAVTAAAAINADQFISIAAPKVASPTNKTKPNANASSTATTVAVAAMPQLINKTTMPTPTTTIASTPATKATTTTTTTNATATTATATAVASPKPNDSDTRGDDNHLSKFATVSNLARCLQDVDGDLEDYIPSSAENSDDDSLSHYSSVDGCENLSASMKKKLKQRRRQEKAAEKARFDPQKKIKIDPTNKCYVKEEAPRYPLVATPRPLWKREKIVYPSESDDDSDSDEDDGGSTEETEDSEECSTTSEEYEDELRPSGTASSADDGASSATKENSAIIRMSTCSNDSGFEGGGTAPSSPKKMLETSYTYSQFQKSGRFTAPATVIPRFKTYSVDDFHFLAVLGKGSFGKVLLAELRNTEYYYAVKCLKKDVVLEDDDVDSTLIERKVLALGTKHPYLCHLFCTFQTESHLFFVMEYLNGGDLMFHIQESGRFPEERARFYGAEIISGLKFLHKKGIIYRDLKLDNVLLDFDGHVRIADFGMCKLQIYLDKTADSFCGTPDYMAPEIIKGEKYNQNVDWWSFGVLLYEMLIGQSPFSGCDEDELFWSICNEIPWFPVYISAEATSILKGLLEKDYTKRVGSQYSLGGEVSEHIFFSSIDWNLLDKRQLEPPYKPQVKHPLDTQYFDRVFTRERVRLTPIDREILQSMDQKQFHGFSYTNPHITLD